MTRLHVGCSQPGVGCRRLGLSWPAARRLRFARAYFLAVGILVFGLFVASLALILADETLRPLEILIGNAGVVMAGIVVPALLLFAVRLLRRRARSGAVVAALAFALLVLGVPLVGAGAVLAPGVAVIGLVLALDAWRQSPPPPL